MKKTYVKPQSKLFSLKMKENIAVSTPVEDEITDTFVISFTQNIEPCRKLYTGLESAPNTLGDNAPFMEYFYQLQALGAWACFKNS